MTTGMQAVAALPRSDASFGCVSYHEYVWSLENVKEAPDQCSPSQVMPSIFTTGEAAPPAVHSAVALGRRSRDHLCRNMGPATGAALCAIARICMQSR